MVFSLFRPSIWLATGLVAVFTTVAAYLHQPASVHIPPLPLNPPETAAPLTASVIDSPDNPNQTLPSSPMPAAPLATVEPVPPAEESNPPSSFVDLPEMVQPTPPVVERNPLVSPGLVRWHASFAAAQEAAQRSGKPVLLFHMMGHLDRQFC